MKPNPKILVLGSSNTDMIVKSRNIPRLGETVLGGEFVMGAGGKGANQAVAAKRLGADVCFICKVGNDLFGDSAISGYIREGIDTSRILRSSKASGVALILVDSSAENCISVASGANADFSVEDVESCRDALCDCDILLLQNEIPTESVARAARLAHEAGAYVILNPAPAAELPEDIFGCIDLMIPNQVEAGFYSGVSIVDEESAVKAAQSLKAMGVANVIITMGSKGSLCCVGGKVVFTEARKVKAVDTTAAGDTFCGALAVAVGEGKSLAEAVLFATAASALAVQKVGAQESIPYRSEL